MEDPRVIVQQVRQGSIPPLWRVLLGKRSLIGGFFGETLKDPHPLLIVMPEGIVEYINETKPIDAITFAYLVDMRLQVTGSSFHNSAVVNLSAWLDLHSRAGKKRRWKPSSNFGDEFLVMQYVIEAYGMYKLLNANATT